MMEVRNRRLFILGGLKTPEIWRTRIEILAELLQGERDLTLLVEDHPELRRVFQTAPVVWFRDRSHAQAILGIPEISPDAPKEKKEKEDVPLSYALAFTDEDEDEEEKTWPLDFSMYEKAPGQAYPEAFLGAVLSREGVGLWALSFEVADALDGVETLYLRGRPFENDFLGFSHTALDTLLFEWLSLRGASRKRRPLWIRARIRTLATRPSHPFDPDPRGTSVVHFAFFLAWQRVAVKAEDVRQKG